MNSKPTLYVLVGVPGAGKSTWIKNQDWAVDCAVVSTDNWVEAHARNEGKTYDEVFKDYMPTAVKRMTDDVYDAEAVGADIIWDQTSTTAKSRARKLRMLPDYHKVAIVFPTPEPAELQARLASRPGKTIPRNIVMGMIRHWEDPTEDEGFDEVWLANEFVKNNN